MCPRLHRPIGLTLNDIRALQTAITATVTTAKHSNMWHSGQGLPETKIVTDASSYAVVHQFNIRQRTSSQSRNLCFVIWSRQIQFRLKRCDFDWLIALFAFVVVGSFRSCTQKALKFFKLPQQFSKISLKCLYIFFKFSQLNKYSMENKRETRLDDKKEKLRRERVCWMLKT